MALGTLYTLGYKELRGTPDLRDLVRGHPIDILFDVRFQPASRNPLWRKEVVKQTVERADPNGHLQYRGLPELGNPDYKVPGSRWPSSKPATRLAEPDRIRDVLEPLEAGQNVAVMCVCPTTAKCHRRLIVAAVRVAHPDIEVVELEVPDEESPKA